MEANLCSPASSDIKKTYSGAVTWFDRWVLPVEGKKKKKRFEMFHQPSGRNWLSDRNRRNPSGYGSFWCHQNQIVWTDQTAEWLCQHSRAALASCGLFSSGSSLDGQLARKYLSWRLLRWWRCAVWEAVICWRQNRKCMRCQLPENSPNTFSPSMNLCFSVKLRISTGTSSSERDS